MARVTVEDCIDKVENRFDLVLLASHRARMVSSGSPITVERDNDKNPVVALREIAETTISPADLREELVHSLQKYVEVDEPEPEAVPLISAAGGAVDADETCREAAVREAREEGGLALEAMPELFHIYRNPAGGRRDHVVLFVARGAWQARPSRPGFEIVAAGFHPLGALPNDLTAPTRSRIAEVLEGRPAGDTW